MMDKYIKLQDAIDALGEEPENWIDDEFDLGTADQWRWDLRAIKAVEPEDVVPWSWLENYIDSFGPILRADYKGFIKLARYKYEGV